MRRRRLVGAVRVVLPSCAVTSPPAPQPVVPPTPEFHPGARVLVADDIRVNRALLRRAFARPEPPSMPPCGLAASSPRHASVRPRRDLPSRRAFTKRFGAEWRVQEATTAEEALEALRPGHAFDLLVMDEIFSDMDDGCMRGSAAIRLLRAREETEGLARLAVISCTGNASHQSGQLLECRADLVWNKPFPSAEDGTMQRDIARLLPRLVRPDGERGANGAESARAPRTPKAGSCSESVF